MATDIPAPEDSEGAAAPLEVYARADNGQFLPRLTRAGLLLKSVNVEITNIQFNVARPDLTPVFDLLRALPHQLQHKALLKSYKGALNLYENYLEHGDDLYLKEVLLRCASEVPDFESGLENALEAVVPDQYDFRFANGQLEPLKSLCNSYLGMLAYHFHAVTIHHPDTAAKESTIQGFIDRAIGMLKKKLRETLMPGNTIDGSLYLEAFHEVDSDRFERYLAYDDRAVSSQDIRKFVAFANRNGKRDNEIRLDKPKVGSNVRMLADTLIELIDRFETLLTAKNSFRPQTKGEPGFPIET